MPLVDESASPPPAPRWRRALRHSAVPLAALVLAHLALPPWYDYPPPEPFAGDRWHNPYQGLSGPWIEGNTHAHSSSGPVEASFHTESPEELRDRYRELGYGVYLLSDYQTITPAAPDQELYLTAYEHGFGIWKTHHTVIGAREVCWLDLPLFQLTDAKQWLIDVLRPTAELVVANHPDMRSGFTVGDMERLCGYPAMEIKTRYGDGLTHWDAALSAGRLVWGVCADDSHKPRQVRAGWIRLAPRERTAAAVVDAIREGRFYGVFSRHREPVGALESCALSEEGELTVRVTPPADAIRFVGQGGRTLAEVSGGLAEGRYRLAPEDSYVRVEVHYGRAQLYHNPVVRYQREPLERTALRARPVLALTWVRRGGALLLLGLLAWALYGRRSGAASAAEVDDDVPEADAGEQRNST